MRLLSTIVLPLYFTHVSISSFRKVSSRVGSALIGYLNGLGLNNDSCTLVFGFLLGALVHVLVTLALLSQTPKRRQGHHVMFGTWLILKLVQYHSLTNAPTAKCSLMS